MADLFVSYRYWSERFREYKIENAVIGQEDLYDYDIVNIATAENLAALESVLEPLGATILYWRRMEEPKGE